MQAIERGNFQWFQGHDIFSISSYQRWYKIKLYLRWQIDKKSYDSLNCAIFNDIEWPLTQIKGHAIVRHWISPKWYKIDRLATTYCTANTKHYMAICSLCIKLCHCARDVWRSTQPFINSAFLNSFIVCIWYEVNCNGQTLNVSNYFCCRIPPEGLLHVATKTDYKYINKHADDKLKI